MAFDWEFTNLDHIAGHRVELRTASHRRYRSRQPRQHRATHLTTLRLDEDMVKRLGHVAELKQVPNQPLLEQFVFERLYEEEKRLGIL